MVNSKKNPNNYKTLKRIIGTIIKNTQLLRFALDHIEAKKMSKTAVKKLPFVIKYVLD